MQVVIHNSITCKSASHMIGDKYLHMVVVQLMAHLSYAQIYEKNRISEKKGSETKSNIKVFCNKSS